LLLQRYLAKPATGNQGDPEERRALLQAAIEAAQAEPLKSLYKQAFDHWDNSFRNDGYNDGLHLFVDLSTANRLIVGLGSENVLETGIRLHHTYGLPFIPGSALKGLASHYCDHVWGSRGEANPPKENKLFRRGEKYHQFLFGNTDDGGVITFHDAWLLPEKNLNVLKLDVMTPHHPDWPTKKTPPTDFDSPIPVTFLSVSGAFRVRVSWAGPAGFQQSAEWTSLALELLKEALADWGVGGKTSSGYGRLVYAERGVSTCAVTDTKQSITAPSGPRHERGEQIIVTRIEDKNNKKRFQADDGFVGYMDAGEGPDIDVGQTTKLWVAIKNPQGYTFSLKQPKVKEKPSHQQHKRDR